MQKDGIRYTILVHLASGDHRGLPKGHGEIGETSVQSAMRELAEETGLQITEENVDNTKEYSESYQCFSKRHNQEVQKTVVYYTATLPYTDITSLSGYSEGDGEILGKKIINIDDAILSVTYDNLRTILQDIKNQL